MDSVGLLPLAQVWIVVVVHMAFTLLVALGGFLVWRWPRAFWPHMALLAWAISIPILEPRCPLTDLEKHLRREAGLPVYSTHFIDHYVYRSLQPHPWLLELFMVGMPVLSYTLLARRGRARVARGQV
jgi:hypothetical protein